MQPVSWPRAVVAAGLFLAVATASAADVPRRLGGMPAVLYTGDGLPHASAFPIFVSAEAAVDGEGRLTDKVTNELSRQLLGRLLAKEAEEGCIQAGPLYEDAVVLLDRPDLPATLASAPVVLVARVVDREFGFSFWVPGQLLEIEVEEVVRGRLPRDRYYVFYPVGTFEAGPYRICKTDPRFPEPPALGERVLLMLPAIEDPDEPYLDLDAPEAVVVLGGEETRLPRRFREQRQAPLAAAELLRDARRAGEGQAGREVGVSAGGGGGEGGAGVVDTVRSG